MQDRFKFRIFDKVQNKMIELDAVGYSSFDPFSKGINRLIMIPAGLNNTFSYNKQCLYENNNFSEPMQCTGLKDKNGELIYEEDIVRNNLHNNLVEWYKGGFWINGFINGAKWNIHLCHTSLEVIGNIYENPELLRNEE